ncbi:MAG: DUF502 domain-containing protein [Planctomycetota bacterium]
MGAHKRTFGTDFKQFFGRGLAILLPSIVTLWLLWQALVFVYANVAEPINRGLRAGVLWATPRLVTEENLPGWFVVTDEQVIRARVARESDGRPAMTESELRGMIRERSFREAWAQNWYLNAAGFIVAILLIYFAGLLLGNYVGRRVYARVEQLIAKMPGFKQVYPHVKQVVDLIFGDNKTMKAFNEVVLIEYPRKGVWTVGLVTGGSFDEVRENAGCELVSVFVPTSPTPMTGFVINVPRADAKTMDMTVDQALRFVITAGVLTPENVSPAEAIEGGENGRARPAALTASGEVVAVGVAEEPGVPGGVEADRREAEPGVVEPKPG